MVLKHRKKVSPKNDINHLFKNSMLTGIPQIAAAGNWQKKIVRSAVFVFCVGGFIYQTLSFMNVYWKYQTVVDVQVFSPLEVEKPAFTICGQFGFRTSKFCADPDVDFVKKYDLHCNPVESDEYYDWCSCLPRLCTTSGELLNVSTLFIKDYVNLREQPWDDVKKYMASELDYLESCVEMQLHPGDMERDCFEVENPLAVPCQFNPIASESCFTRNSLVFRPNETAEKVLSTGEIWLVLNLLELDYPTEMKGAKLYISLHNPYTIVNPMIDGFIMENAKEYYFHFKKVVKNLLPYPYETNCRDYLTQWKERGGRGPTNLKECIQECQRNLSLERNGCLIDTVNYPGFDLKCPFGTNDLQLLSFTQECVHENCKPACYEEYYDVVLDVASNTEEFSCFELEYKERLDMVDVRLLLNGMETTVYTYSPKYQDIETFSYVGGYIGMWLGISLIAVFDFLETMVTLLKYPLKRMRYYRAKNSVAQFQPGRVVY